MSIIIIIISVYMYIHHLKYISGVLKHDLN